MKGQLTVLSPDGTKTVTELTAAPSLEQMQGGVGGYIETVPYFEKFDGSPCIAFCNEEGKLDGLPFNPEAHRLWEIAFGQPITEDKLVGPIVIITGDRELMDAL